MSYYNTPLPPFPNTNHNLINLFGWGKSGGEGMVGRGREWGGDVRERRIKGRRERGEGGRTCKRSVRRGKRKEGGEREMKRKRCKSGGKIREG